MKTDLLLRACRARAESAIALLRRGRPEDARLLVEALSRDARQVRAELEREAARPLDASSEGRCAGAIQAIDKAALALDSPGQDDVPLVLRRSLRRLDEVRSAVLGRKGGPSRPRLAAGALLALAALVLLGAFWQRGAGPGTGKAAVDLTAIRAALQKYHADHGAYPESQAFDGLYSKFGASKADWIAGLAPEYIPELPRDPRRNDDTDCQYLYMSDGRDYKLVRFNPDDCQAVAQSHPDMIDPAAKCAYYGYWTAAAAPWQPTEHTPGDFREDLFSRRLADLTALRYSLERYRADHGAYPEANGLSGLYSAAGQLNPDWIPGLVPKYLPALPRDPRGGSDPARQYYYASDGRDYKLIAHNVEGCYRVFKQRPDLIDPARHCWAYGYWTEGAQAW
jgi:hypothetical protein